MANKLVSELQERKSHFPRGCKEAVCEQGNERGQAPCPEDTGASAEGPELSPAPLASAAPCPPHPAFVHSTAAVTLKVQFTLRAHTALRPGRCLTLHLPLSLATPSFVAFPENPVLLAPAPRLCFGCSLRPFPFPFPELCQLTALVVQGSTLLSTSPESPFLTFQFKVYSDCIITILNLHKAFKSATRNDFVVSLFLLRQRPACLFTVCFWVRTVPGTEQAPRVLAEQAKRASTDVKAAGARRHRCSLNFNF